MTGAGLHKELAVALAWLTRLPTRYPDDAPTLAAAAWAFPLVGAMLGAGAASVFMLAWFLGAPALLAGVLAVATLTLLTGGLHEDGLSDFFDGLGARGAEAEALAAMRDSHLGNYGALALIITFAVRAAALSSPTQALALIAICGLSRAAMIHVMRNLPQARTDGAAAAAGHPDESGYRSAALIALGLTGFWIVFAGGGVLTAVLAVAAGGAAVYWIMSAAQRRLGGYTGDVLGAVCMASETAMLAMVAVFST